MLKLIWAADARAQLVSIIEHIAPRNPPAAERLERLIDEAVDRARRFPQIGRPGRVDGTRELIVHPNYLIVYRAMPDAIDVLRIVHARQRYP